MLKDKKADEVQTKGGRKVLELSPIPFAQSSDNSYAAVLEGFDSVFLYNSDGQCTEQDHEGEDFDLVVV